MPMHYTISVILNNSEFLISNINNNDLGEGCSTHIIYTDHR